MDAGATDLSDLGFWRLVGRVKRDRQLIERHADQIGRIDAKAFRARFRLRFPPWVGLALMLAGIATGIAAAWLALAEGRSAAADPTIVGIASIVAAAMWAAGVHSFTHYVVGRAVGIRFTDFFAAIPPPPLPGLKTDYATYLRVSPRARVWMHASGAIATKLAPFLAVIFAVIAEAPAWSVVALVALGTFQLVTDVVFSAKSSDWKKVRRELAVARDTRAR